MALISTERLCVLFCMSICKKYDITLDLTVYFKSYKQRGLSVNLKKSCINKLNKTMYLEKIKLPISEVRA